MQSIILTTIDQELMLVNSFKAPLLVDCVCVKLGQNEHMER